MGRPYRREIERVPETVSWAQGLEVEGLESLLAPLAGRNLITVGSGGSHVAAIFAAQLHETTFGGTGKALTPLEALARPTSPDTSVLLLSGRGNNPDILRAFETLSRRAYAEVAAICAREGSPLARRMGARGHSIFEFQPPGGRDGFLATNSLVATLVVLARAYVSVVGETFPQITVTALGESRCDLDIVREVASRDTLIALAEGWGAAAAADLESRFTEAALANVSVTDFRNFAHGRHHWLDRRRSTSAVVSFETPSSERFASRVVRVLPDDIPVLRVRTPNDGPAGAVDLVCASLSLALAAGDTRDMDPGRPIVADFGRKLYRGSAGARSIAARSSWIERKAHALGLPPGYSRDAIEKALTAYVSRLSVARVRGLALDYDGTLCSAENRFKGIDPAVSDQLSRILAGDVPVAIATGRGRSAHGQLRSAVRPEYWDKVLLGLYNGGTLLKLSDDIDVLQDEPSDLESLRSHLARLSEVIPIDYKFRKHQVSVLARSGLSLHTARDTIEEVLSRTSEDVQVRASGHSIDIFPRGTSKNLVVDGLIEQLPSPVSADAILRIGDRGTRLGNDAEFLNSGLSLSSDAVSGSLDACWYLAPHGAVGPAATLAYLGALRPLDSGVLHLDFDRLRKGLSAQ